MKLSLQSLSAFVDIKDYFSKPGELASLLTKKGLEVEGIEDFTSLYNLIEVAEVKKKEPIEGTSLSHCQVRVKDNIYSVICGADNFKAGDKVVLALPGAILPGKIKMKERTIRGVLSQGMLLSFSELGFAEPLPLPAEQSSDTKKTNEQNKRGGIIVLDPSFLSQKSFTEETHLKDIIFDFAITPNRGDVLSHFGMARELSIILDRELKEPPVPHIQGTVKDPLQVKVLNPVDCPRYTTQGIFNVSIKPSPLWLKFKLERLGFKSINNIVDITNFFLIEWGQPLHAFDRDVIKGNTLQVGAGKRGEPFPALDGTDITLKGVELCIRDGESPAAIAGVMGSRAHSVTTGTKNIQLESASFHSDCVRASSKLHNLNTESSYRFVRSGVPSQDCLKMLDRALGMMQEMAGGSFSKEKQDIGDNKPDSNIIVLKKKYLEKRLGYKVSGFEDCIRAQGFSFASGMHKEDAQHDGDRVFKLKAPYYRQDVQIAEDVIEEYARHVGFEDIPESWPHFPPALHNIHYTHFNRLASFMTQRGYFEVINSGLLSKGFLEDFFKVRDHSKDVPIKNPLSSELNVMRPSLLPSLFKNALLNIRSGVFSGKVFETGHVFAKHKQKSRDVSYSEAPRLGLLVWRGKNQWSLWEKGSKQRSAVYDIKSVISALFEQLRVDYVWSAPVGESEVCDSFFHPHQTLDLKTRDGKSIGRFGTLHPAYCTAYKLKEDVSLGELNADFLFQAISQFKPNKIKNPSRFPGVLVDQTYEVPQSVPVFSILKEMEKQGRPLLASVKVWDVYQKPLDSKKENRSPWAVTFRLLFQSFDRTLKEEEVKNQVKKIENQIQKKWDLSLKS